MTRERLIALAEDIVRMASTKIFRSKRVPYGVRLVVVVTDANGEWVGVSSNTNPVDVEAILGAALRGADRRSATRVVLDVEGEPIR